MTMRQDKQHSTAQHSTAQHSTAQHSSEEMRAQQSSEKVDAWFGTKWRRKGAGPAENLKKTNTTECGLPLPPSRRRGGSETLPIDYVWGAPGGKGGKPNPNTTGTLD